MRLNIRGVSLLKGTWVVVGTVKLSSSVVENRQWETGRTSQLTANPEDPDEMPLNA